VRSQRTLGTANCAGGRPQGRSLPRSTLGRLSNSVLWSTLRSSESMQGAATREV